MIYLGRRGKATAGRAQTQVQAPSERPKERRKRQVPAYHQAQTPYRRGKEQNPGPIARLIRAENCQGFVQSQKRRKGRAKSGTKSATNCKETGQENERDSTCSSSKAKN